MRISSKNVDSRVCGILIDPFSQVVSEVIVGDPLKLFDILEIPRELWQGNVSPSDTADWVVLTRLRHVDRSDPLLGGSHFLIVANELITAHRYFVIGKGYFAGKAVIVGFRRKEILSAETPIAHLRDLVRYARSARFNEHPLFQSNVGGIVKPYVIDDGKRECSLPSTTFFAAGDCIRKEDTAAFLRAFKDGLGIKREPTAKMQKAIDYILIWNNPLVKLTQDHMIERGVPEKWSRDEINRARLICLWRACTDPKVTPAIFDGALRMLREGKTVVEIFPDVEFNVWKRQ